MALGGTLGTEELEQVRYEVQALKGQRSALRDELRAVERAIKEKDAPEAYLVLYLLDGQWDFSTHSPKPVVI